MILKIRFKKKSGFLAESQCNNYKDCIL